MANDSMGAKTVDANKSNETEADIEKVLAFLDKRGLRTTKDTLLGEIRGTGSSTSNSTATSAPGRTSGAFVITCLHLALIYRSAR